MIPREITSRMTALFGQYPFVTVTGPRQSGKTTLCRAAFPELAYVNLERPDQRELAESDPLMISALGNDCDSVLHFFSSGSDIGEDPETGSVHCVFAPYPGLTPRQGTSI